MAIPVITDEIQKKANLVECNRCGKCCRLPSGKDCKFLARTGDGRSYCRIYNRAGRIGTPIGEGCVCNNILHVPWLLEGCTYNDVKREIYGEEIEEKK